ncbi:MAG TPA: helix-turn-helix transcriptional regulator [Ktedonobacteraceae bacterium]|jgi:transcriptional regulator with XRE-family HTH domain
MPRPSKRVAPDTLGGRLRAARQSLHLSLADVAGEKYSTSLISQIERNRVDPSPESLRYLAERLKLPFDELQNLARQHRESETEANLYREYEAKYAQISQLLARHQLTQALEGFHTLDLNQMPHFMRWRTLALRGQTYYEQREFLRAQRDFQSALTILPASIAEEYQLEVARLHLHLAAATRELNQLAAAMEYYQAALNSMDASTPLRYVAEAHWGLALVLHRQARNTALLDGNSAVEESPDLLLQAAGQHAEDARTLYNAIADSLNAALLQCQIALIEQARGQIEQSGRRLLDVLDTWKPSLAEDFRPEVGARLYQLPDRANVVSAAACYLAAMEYQAGRLEAALDYVHLALQAGTQSYKVRQAEALLMQGQILEARDACDPLIEGAYRQAVEILRGTDRRAIQAQAHYQLGRYLLTSGKTEEASREIEMVRELAGLAGDFSALPPGRETSKHG